MSRVLGAVMAIGLTSLVFAQPAYTGAREGITATGRAGEPSTRDAGAVRIDHGTTTREAVPERFRHLAQARASEAPEAPSFRAPDPFSNQQPATEARRRLATAIQTELQRVGCYSGLVSGDWDTPTRRAMKAFNDHVNASLPIGDPDYVLLTLVRGHHAKACGTACRRGEALAASGRCVPRSVVAEERRQASRVVQSKEPEPIAAPSPKRPEAGPSATTPSRETAATGAIAGDSRAEASRIAAVDARKRLELAEANARAETDRRARLVEIEKARRLAESRRQDELKALDARRRAKAAPQRPEPLQSPPTAALAAAPNTPPAQAGATLLSPPVSITGPASLVTVSGPSLVAPSKARPAGRNAGRRANRKRYAGRPIPPPTYRIGRLAPSRFEPPRRVVFRARRNPQMIFRSVQHLAP
jgi:hypothetical protein